MSDSIMQSEKVCFVTGATVNLDKHHIFHGSRRKAADKWGCWCWLEHSVHMDLHQKDQYMMKESWTWQKELPLKKCLILRRTFAKEQLNVVIGLL